MMFSSISDLFIQPHSVRRRGEIASFAGYQQHLAGPGSSKDFYLGKHLEIGGNSGTILSAMDIK